MHNNHIAVLIINRNDYNNTKECLDSLIKNNSDAEYSIVIIDNDSKDWSREKLIAEFWLKEINPTNYGCEKNDIFKEDKAFSDYKWWNVCISLNDNYWFTGANNFWMKFAWQNNFDYIMWLNNDTIVNENLINSLERWAEKYPNSLLSPKIVFYPDIDYVRFLWADFDFLWRPRSYFFKKNHNLIEIEDHLESVLCSWCAMFYSRDVLKTLWWQDNNYFFNLDDADYSYYAHTLWINTYVNTKIILYHKSARSVAKRPWLALYYYLRNVVYFRKKFFPRYKNILIYIYLFIHMCGVLIIFGLKWKNTLKFIKDAIHDIFKWKMGKYV